MTESLDSSTLPSSTVEVSRVDNLLVRLTVDFTTRDIKSRQPIRRRTSTYYAQIRVEVRYQEVLKLVSIIHEALERKLTPVIRLVQVTEGTEQSTKQGSGERRTCVK